MTDETPKGEGIEPDRVREVVALADLTNRFGVTATRGQVLIIMPPAPRQLMHADEALLLAAWLVVGIELAQPDESHETVLTLVRTLVDRIRGV